MDVVLWVIAWLVAAAFAGAGLFKLTSPTGKLREAGLDWVEDFTPEQVRLIGLAEVLGAIGVVVPPLVGIAPVLAPLAATGLALTMAGATYVHLRRGENSNASATIALLLLTAFLAAMRFGPQAFQ